MDAGAFQYDGNIIEIEDKYRVEATVIMPPQSISILGISTGQDGLGYKVAFELPKDFLDQPFVPITTPYGPVNMRLVKLRDL